MSGFALGIAPKWGKKICLPDKEFRYLRQCCYSHHRGFDDAGQVISAWLCMSPCSSDCIFTRSFSEPGPSVQSLRIPCAYIKTLGFLLIVRTGRIVTAHALTLRRGCDTNEYRRMLGYSSI
jgi:hypothetical protein